MNTTKFKIEENVPLARITRPPRCGPYKYPWADMKVGDSFLAGEADQRSLYSVAAKWVERHENGWQFKSRREGKGRRIWRIK